MTIALVKHTVVQLASGSPQVFTGITSTAGNTLVAVITVKAGSTSDVSAVTDSSGANTWVAGPNAFISGVNSRVAIWYVTNAAAIGTSVTVTLTLAKAASIDVREYSGVVTASPVDSSGAKTNNVTGIPQLSGPVTTANANDVLVAGVTQATASIACSSVSAGFNLSANAQATSTLCAVYSADQIVAATGTYECTFTMASSGAATGGTILALKEDAGGGISLTAPLGTLSTAGLAADTSTTLDATLATVTVAGLAADTTITATAPLGTVALTGLDVDTTMTLTAPLVTVPVVGLDADMAFALDAPLATLALAGLVADFSIVNGDISLNAPLAVLPVTGLDPTFSLSVVDIPPVIDVPPGPSPPGYASLIPLRDIITTPASTSRGEQPAFRATRFGSRFRSVTPAEVVPGTRRES